MASSLASDFRQLRKDVFSYIDSSYQKATNRIDRVEALVINSNATSRWSIIKPIPKIEGPNNDIYSIPRQSPDRVAKFWHLRAPRNHATLVDLLNFYSVFEADELNVPLDQYVTDNIDEVHARLAQALNLNYSAIRLEMEIAEERERQQQQQWEMQQQQWKAQQQQQQKQAEQQQQFKQQIEELLDEIRKPKRGLEQSKLPVKKHKNIQPKTLGSPPTSTLPPSTLPLTTVSLVQDANDRWPARDPDNITIPSSPTTIDQIHWDNNPRPLSPHQQREEIAPNPTIKTSKQALPIVTKSQTLSNQSPPSSDTDSTDLQVPINPLHRSKLPPPTMSTEDSS